MPGHKPVRSIKSQKMAKDWKALKGHRNSHLLISYLPRAASAVLPYHLKAPKLPETPSKDSGVSDPLSLLCFTAQAPHHSFQGCPNSQGFRTGGPEYGVNVYRQQSLGLISHLLQPLCRLPPNKASVLIATVHRNAGSIQEHKGQVQKSRCCLQNSFISSKSGNY